MEERSEREGRRTEPCESSRRAGRTVLRHRVYVCGVWGPHRSLSHDGQIVSNAEEMNSLRRI